MSHAFMQGFFWTLGSLTALLLALGAFAAIFNLILTEEDNSGYDTNPNA